MTYLVNILFGCWHRRLSFPITHPHTDGPIVCCLDCGATFGYDFTAMRRERTRRAA